MQISAARSGGSEQPRTRSSGGPGRSTKAIITEPKNHRPLVCGDRKCCRSPRCHTPSVALFSGSCCCCFLRASRKTPGARVLTQWHGIDNYPLLLLEHLLALKGPAVVSCIATWAWMSIQSARRRGMVWQIAAIVSVWGMGAALMPDRKRGLSHRIRLVIFYHIGLNKEQAGFHIEKQTYIWNLHCRTVRGLGVGEHCVLKPL